METVTLPAFAKINLTLRVAGKRADCFHELFTIFQSISLCDRLTFSPGDKLELTCSDPEIPCDERNLVIKAANAIRERAGVDCGARIELEKNIPSPGGLGGGSSDAAAALIGLTRLWELDLTEDELAEIAASLGSDVSYFLVGGTVIGTGRGTELEPVEDIKWAGPMLIVSPEADSGTAAAYSRLNAPSLTTEELVRILRVYRSEAESVLFEGTGVRNDLEASVFAAFPEVEEVKAELLRLGATTALMSGSGPSVFAVFDNNERRQTALEALGHRSDWRKFAVAAVSRREYREGLGMA